MSLLEVVYILVHYARTQDSLIHITSRPLATRYLAHTSCCRTADRLRIFHTRKLHERACDSGSHATFGRSKRSTQDMVFLTSKKIQDPCVARGKHYNDIDSEKMTTLGVGESAKQRCKRRLHNRPGPSNVREKTKKKCAVERSCWWIRADVCIVPNQHTSHRRRACTNLSRSSF
jgi:hypothetical protein